MIQCHLKIDPNKRKKRETKRGVFKAAGLVCPLCTGHRMLSANIEIFFGTSHPTQKSIQIFFIPRNINKDLRRAVNFKWRETDDILCEWQKLLGCSRSHFHWKSILKSKQKFDCHLWSESKVIINFVVVVVYSSGLRKRYFTTQTYFLTCLTKNPHKKTVHKTNWNLWKNYKSGILRT